MKLSSRSLAILWLVVLFLLGSFVWWTAYDRTFIAIPYNDGLDYASIALNIANGKGVISSYLTPLSLAHAEAPYPNIWRAPLWPLILAGSYLLAEPADWVVAGITGLFYLLTIIPLFLLARRLVGLEVAVGAVVIYLLSPRVLHFSLSGMTEPIATFFMVTWVYLLYRVEEGKTPYLVLLGVVAGLFYLTRYNALLFFPLSVVYLGVVLLGRNKENRRSFGAGKFKLSELRVGNIKDRLLDNEAKKVYAKLAIYSLVWLLTISPWLVRNTVLMGSPLFSLQSYEPVMFTATYPDYTGYMLTEKPDVKRFMVENPEEMADKFLTGVESFKSDFFDEDFSGVHSWLVGLALIGLVLPQRKDQLLLKGLVVSCYLLQLVSLWVIHYIPRLFIIFTPFLIIFALMTLWQLFSLAKRPVLATGLLAVAVGLAVWYNPFNWEGRNTWYDWPGRFSQVIADSREYFAPGDVIVSNDGHVLSWYADRTAIKIPVHPDQLADLMERAPVKGIFLSDLLLWPNSNTPEADLIWNEYMREQQAEIGPFKLVEVYANGSMLYVHESLIGQEVQ